MLQNKMVSTHQLMDLRDNISRFFNEEGVRLLCFDLDVDFDEVSGKRKTEKIQDLLTLLNQQGRLTPLLIQLKNYRPNINWESYLPAEPMASSPFKGLRYFEEKDATLFFGRQQLTAELIQHLSKYRFLAVVGASGSGKSSVVRAGVISALRQGAIESNGRSSADWRIEVITPGNAPLKTLATCLTYGQESVTATQTLIADLERSADSLDLYIYRQMKDQPNGRFLLVVDQFEELFTQCTDVQKRRWFIENLITAAQTQQQGPFSLILIIRADFYVYAMQYDRLCALLETRQKIVGNMNASELREAIEMPAKQGGWQYQTGLVETILQDVEHEPGALPLLSQALQETWENREGYLLTLAGYHAVGGVKEAIAHKADTVYAQLSSEQQALARAIFLRLTHLGEGTEDTSRRVFKTELIPQPEKQAMVDELLQTLVQERLLTLSTTYETNGRWLEVVAVAHEALIRKWPLLRQWLSENRTWLRLHHQLATDAQEWSTAAQDPDQLYRGSKLIQVREQLAEHSNDLNEIERTFIQASLQEQERQNVEKEKQHQKELKQARQFGALSITFLFVVFLLLMIPARNEWYRWQASKVPLRPILGSSNNGEIKLGNPSNDIIQEMYLPYGTYTVTAFAIEAYEVTYQRYNACVKAQACFHPFVSSEIYLDPDQQQHPVTYVTAVQAREFCLWIGRDLPTQQEWEWAARYPDGRSWPWGEGDIPSEEFKTISPTLIWMPINNDLQLKGSQEVDSAQKDKSYAEIYGLVGNVAEWTKTTSDLTTWKDVTTIPLNLSVVGGSFFRRIDHISYRFDAATSFSYSYIGFRCVEPRS